MFVFFFSRKKTLLSLAKLHLVTEGKLGPDPEVVQNEIEMIEAELTLLSHQEQLPSAVLQALDLDTSTMRVLTPLELIEVTFFTFLLFLFFCICCSCKLVSGSI